MFMTVEKMMSLGQELAVGNGKASIGKIHQLYRSAISKFGKTKDAIEHFYNTMGLYEAQGKELSGGLTMLQGILDMLHKDFMLSRNGDTWHVKRPDYQSLTAEEWGYVLGYAMRYAVIREKSHIPGKDISERKGADMSAKKRTTRSDYDDRNKRTQYPKSVVNKRDNQQTTAINNPQTSINNALAEQMLKWKNQSQ